MVFSGSSPITTTSPSSKAHQKSGSFPSPALPGFDGRMTLSDSARGAACRDVEAATLAHNGSPPITRTTFPTCRAYYPGGSSRCACRLLPRSCSLPQMAGGSASALSLSRGCSGFTTLRPARSLSRLKRPLSRGSSPASCPTEPLVSFQTNRQLSGWNSSSTDSSRLRGARPLADFADYSITSSAMLSTPEGIPRPSAFAVFILITSSNLVGCMIGSSPGFSPLRTRAA